MVFFIYFNSFLYGENLSRHTVWNHSANLIKKSLKVLYHEQLLLGHFETFWN